MILGVDPGLRHCGWALVHPETARVRALGVIVTENDPFAARSDDRRRRTHMVARELRHAVLAFAPPPGLTRIAGEAMSFPRGVDGIASIALTWGILCGLAAHRGWGPPDEVPPKLWQHAILPRANSKERGAISYVEVERKLQEHVEHFGDAPARSQLAHLPRALRTHALDAAGVGIYAALRIHGGA